MTQHKTLNVTSKCPYNLCDGHGMRIFNRDGKITAGNCKCMDEKIEQRKLEFAKIPDEFQNLTVKSYDVNLYKLTDSRDTARMAKKAVAGYIQNFEEMQEMGKGLFLHSEKKGSGKTRLAVSCGNALIKTYGQRVRFITTLDLLSKIKQSYNDIEHITEHQLVNEFSTIPVLILDDIGTEKATAWVTEIFFKILDTRMTHKRVTIVTSNMNIEKLDHDERIKSRLRKMVIRVQMPEEDIRRQLGESENDELLKRLIGG